MRKILLIGAGRSTSSLINYLIKNSSNENWQLIIADKSIELAKSKIGNQKNAQPIAFDVNNEIQRNAEIQNADIVISMLPAALHLLVARDCLKYKRHLVTASYISPEIQQLNQAAIDNNLIFLNEMGLDPGIDHMSAMKVINSIKDKGGIIQSFKSYCGGLVAPESNDNPWGYKFTWNPMNVILAGINGARYIEKGLYKELSYAEIFNKTELVKINEVTEFDSYANRDSLNYRVQYGLATIPTLFRGTLRSKGFCKSWNALRQLGMTNDSEQILTNQSWSSWLVEKTMHEAGANLKEKVATLLGENNDSEVMSKIEWLGVFENEPMIGKTPAEALLKLLETKWKLGENDRDMVVMVHQFSIDLEGKKETIQSSLVVKGEDANHTAMAKTVGLPMGIAIKLILNNKIKSRGVVIPTEKEFYLPVLNELESYGIHFVEEVQLH